MSNIEYITTLDAKSRKSKINIIAKVEHKPESKVINLKVGGTTKVCQLVLADKAGKIDCQLWGDEIDRVKQDDVIRITNGYTKEFQGNISLNVGKFGKLEVVQV